MIKSSIEQAINDQIQAEFYSSYLYLSVSSYFKNAHLDGFGHYYRIQAQEELIHAMKLVDHLSERGGAVRLQALEQPPHEWASPLAGVEAVLHHEQHITARINDLLDLANQEKDHATAVLMHWFVNEQVEEEDNADTLLHQVQMLKDSPHGLLMLDREVAGRPAATAAPDSGAP